MSVLNLDLPDVWESLAASGLPLVLYGSGDGADKLLAHLDALGLSAAGIFASDDFVRPGKLFHGLPLKSLAQLEAELGDFLVLVAFGSPLPALRERILEISRRHPLLIPDLPLAGDAFFDRAFCKTHADELRDARSLFSDDASRRLFDAVLRAKLSGRPDELFSAVSPAENPFAPFSPGPDESFLDLGAYRGDTVRAFCEATGGRFRSVCAVEPDRRSFRKLTEACEDLPDTFLFQAAIGPADGLLPLSDNRGRGTRLAESGRSLIPVRSVDSLRAELARPFTLIKADIEGAEADMLAGARETLAVDLPKLLLSAYHRSEDLFRLPLLIKEIAAPCRLYLKRQPCFPCWEVNIYVIPDETA